MTEGYCCCRPLPVIVAIFCGSLAEVVLLSAVIKAIGSEDQCSVLEGHSGVGCGTAAFIYASLHAVISVG